MIAAVHALQQSRNNTRVDVLERRRRQIDAACKLYSPSRLPAKRHRPTPAWNRFYISNRRRYVYCSIPKVACTSWILTALRLTGKDLSRVAKVHNLTVAAKVHNVAVTDSVIKRVVHFKPAERDALLSKYFKFMFVRDPLERFVSAYRDKCLRDPNYRWLTRAINKRRVKSNSSRTGNITFVEFAEYVVQRWSSRKPLDSHWRPQHQICQPCYINYNFIGRFENLDEDAKYVLAKLTATGGEGSNVSFPYKNAFDKSVPLSQRLKHFYSELSKDVVRKLVHMYKFDYELFGYDYSWLGL